MLIKSLSSTSKSWNSWNSTCKKTNAVRKNRALDCLNQRDRMVYLWAEVIVFWAVYLNAQFSRITWVDHRLSCLRDGNLMSCSAQALVTLVKARLRFSRFPKEPELSRRARSASCTKNTAQSDVTRVRVQPGCCLPTYIRTWVWKKPCS